MSGRCVSCGGDRVAGLEGVVDSLTGEQFSIERCAQCGLGHTTPQPEDLGRYYADYHGKRHGLTASLADWRRVRFVESVFGKRPLSVLDIGCGDGTFLLAGQRQGWKVTGTEMNPVIARNAGLTVFEKVEDAAAQGPFDVVTFWHTLEHMRNPREMVEAASKVLAPGGSIFIAVPNAASVQAKVFGAGWFHLDVPRHLFHFSPESLKTLLSSLGLSVHHEWAQEFEIGLFGWTQSVLNRVMSKPNVLFGLLTGRKVPMRAAFSSTLAGTAVTAAAVPIELAALAARSGATLIYAASRA